MSARGDSRGNGAAARASKVWGRAWLPGLLGLFLLSTLTTLAPAASASNGNYCNFGGNETHVYCGGDFTTSAWNTPWNNLNVNQQACYSVSTNSYTMSVSGGGLYAKESARADESSGCSTNVGIVNVNLGTHGGSFTAWKSGSAYYTVVANFTFNDQEAVGTYCLVSGAPYASAQITSSDAMYDQSTGKGVGWSTSGDHTNLSINDVCNQGGTWQDTNAPSHASFTTNVAIATGDVLVPRGSVTAQVYVSMPGSLTGSAAHCYASLDFDNDGYGYVTIDSIWVS